jgi:hypothetical protein
VRGEESVAWLSIVVRPLCKTYTMLHLKTYKSCLDKLAGQKYFMVFDRVHIFDMFTHFEFWKEMVSTTRQSMAMRMTQYYKVSPSLSPIRITFGCSPYGNFSRNASYPIVLACNS